MESINCGSRRLGLAHFSAIDVAPADFITLAAAAGFSAVGLRLNPAFPGAPSYELKPGSAVANEVKRRLEGEGIEVYDIEFVVVGQDFQPHALLPVLEAAANIGAKRVSVCGDDAETGRFTNNLAALSDLAVPLGLSIDLENMGWRSVATFQDSVRAIQKVARPNACVLVDALHFYRNGGVTEDLVPALDVVRSVQLCDIRGSRPATPEEMVKEARSGRFAPGEGELPLIDFVRAVSKVATFSVEVPMAGGVEPGEHASHLFAATKRILDFADQPSIVTR